MQLNKEIKELVSKWRPTMCNLDDIRIRDIIEISKSRLKDIDTTKHELVKLLKKRIK